MSKDHETPRPGLVELAMDRLGRDTEVEARSPTESTAAGRRAYDQALSRRLAQIRAALGSDEPPVSAPLASSSNLQPAPAATSPSARSGRSLTQGYGIHALLLTGLVSAIAGAGLMWLAISDGRNGMPSEVPTAIATPAVDVPPARVAMPARPVDEDEAKARELVERWRQAWAARDVDAYLACYSADFVAANGQSRSTWAAGRRTKLSSQPQITVAVHHMSIERIADNRMQVEFQQDYSSGSYLEIAQPKTLLLVRTSDDWLIAGEWSGASPALAKGGK